MTRVVRGPGQPNRRRSIAGVTSDDMAAAQRKVAEVAVLAAAAVLGVPPEDALNGPGLSPPLVVVRSAAALALVDLGWTRWRAATHCRANNRVTDIRSKENARARRYLGNLIAAVVAAVEAAVAADPSLVVTRKHRPQAEVMADLRRLSEEVSPRGEAIFVDLHPNRTTTAHRAEVVRRMVAIGHRPRPIAAAIGWSPNAVYNWLGGVRGAAAVITAASG